MALWMLLACWAGKVWGLDVAFEQYSQSERLELGLEAAPSGPAPSPVVRRLGQNSVQIEIPREQRRVSAEMNFPSLTGSRLLTALLSDPAGLVVRTSTPAFGFVAQFDPDSSRLVIDFFPDPLGRRWQEGLTPPAPTGSPRSAPVPEAVRESPADEQADRPATATAPATEPTDTATRPPSTAVAAAQVRRSLQPSSPGPAEMAAEQESGAPRGLEPARIAISPSPEAPLERPAPALTETPPTIPLAASPALRPEPGQGPVFDSSPEMPTETNTERHSESVPESGMEADRSFGSVLRSPIQRIGPEALDAVGRVEAGDTVDTLDTPDTLEAVPGNLDPTAPDAGEEDAPLVQPEPVSGDPPHQRQPNQSVDSVRPEQPTDTVAELPAPGVPRAPIVRRSVTERPDGPAADADGPAGESADSVATADDSEDPTGPVSDGLPAASEVPDVPAADEVAEPEPDLDAEEEPSSDPDQKFRTLLSTSRAAMMNGEFELAIEGLEVLANHPDLSDALREEVLYDLGDALFGLHQGDLADNFGPIAQAYERAMNFNPASRRSALALRNLGVLHLRVNNLPEANAYFNVLKRDYPHDPLVPTSEYYLGQFFLDRGDFDQAADHFQVVVQNHPEHSIAQQSSVGLARALNAMGYDEQAFQIMDFLEKRWPRYYLEEPELLELAGIIALRDNALEVAKQRLLTYYNLVPDTPDAHMLLARIGDIYLLTGRPDPAKRVFEKTAEMFPDQEGGLISKMRLVEGGIHDEPSLEDMFTTRRAADVYSEIISTHPDSPLAAVATIKLAIWQVWNKRFEDSLLVLSQFLESHPRHSLVPKALEVGAEAFSQLVERNTADGRYPEILEQWRSNSFLHGLLDELSPETQLGLAMAYWNEGDLEQAITLARPYLQEDTPRQLQIAALELILGIFLEQQEWERIVDLEPLRDDLPEQQQRELTYSVALALENLDRPEAARPLWRGLAEDLGLSDLQRGYALYFLARNAMQEEQFERVYRYAQEALSLLLLDQEDPGKIRDAVTWLTQVTERTGRLQEALAWALELDRLIERSDPDWSMTRYRLAQLYQRTQNHAEWQAVLEDLKAEDPSGLYGRLAASALQERDLEDSADRFLQ